MEIINCEQRSDEWRKHRLGKITASKFEAVLAKGRGGESSKTRKSYLYELAAEILTEEEQDSYTSDHMNFGIQAEALAKSFYEAKEGVKIDPVGFVIHSEYIGCSPDGFIGKYGSFEAKCPKTTTQIEYYLSKQLPTKYKPQVQGQLWICEREWCDFVTFDPRIKTDAKYFKIRVYRDEDYIKTLKEESGKFIFELLELLQLL